MQDPSIATAADYADAMLTARRAKNVLVLLALLVLLIQLGVFFTARYTNLIFTVDPVDAAIATTQASPVKWDELLQYVIVATNFLGVIFPIVLVFVLLLIVAIMLVGRLIGVARTTSAFIWCLLLLTLLFPWQAFFTAAEFKIPGVLYTWEELTHATTGARFVGEVSQVAILKWARYVGFPVLAVIILLIIQIKSNRGLRQAFGEDGVPDIQ